MTNDRSITIQPAASYAAASVTVCSLEVKQPEANLCMRTCVVCIFSRGGQPQQ